MSDFESHSTDSAIVRFFAEIQAVARCCGRIAAEALPDGLGAGDFAVLDRIARQGAQPSAGQLARGLSLAESEAAQSIDRLEALDFVGKATGREGLCLTHAGRAAWLTATQALNQRFEDVARTVSAPDMIEALPLVERVRRLLEAGSDDDR